MNCIVVLTHIINYTVILSPHWGRSIHTSPLQPPYNMPSWSNPLTPSPSYLSFTLTSTHTHHQHISPHRHLPHCIQAGSGYPTAQKTYIKHLDSYRPVSLLPFIAKTLEQFVFNQLSSFLSKHNLLDGNQSDSATLSHWSPVNCKSWFQIISPHSAGSVCCFWHR